ncbi:hypothetical protein [Methanoculleus chikugoensis]|uniref:hypothetical protein n=1 Tax=Methanoculleus chikugoensis TaxID=118126 RepID=UPI001FB3DC77|nr:hypothetical protein [Methanoculleus chikugoensis]
MAVSPPTIRNDENIAMKTCRRIAKTIVFSDESPRSSFFAIRPIFRLFTGAPPIRK